jgi:hypothetical protein
MRTRAEKMARVLEHFSKERVDPEKVVRRLKSGDGVERIYQRICRNVSAAGTGKTAAPETTSRQTNPDQSDSAND